MFGNRNMIEVANAIARGPARLKAPGLCRQLGLAPSSMHHTLAALAEAGLLKREPRPAGVKEQIYMRQSHPFWTVAERFATDEGQGRVAGAGMEEHA